MLSPMVIPTLPRKSEMIALRLEGLTYAQIGQQYGLSRQRIEQIVSPPPAIIGAIQAREHGICQGCGILVGISGHIHHIGNTEDTYEHLDQLQLLCVSCHRISHQLGFDGDFMAARQRILLGETIILPKGRPKGSKSKSHEGYKKRTQALKQKYGSDIFHKWGKLGGNPILLKDKPQ